MHFAKFTAYDGSPIYVNPMNINRIYESELTGTLTCLNMIGERDEQGTYFVVRESIEKVIGVLENECY